MDSGGEVKVDRGFQTKVDLLLLLLFECGTKRLSSASQLFFAKTPLIDRENISRPHVL